MNGKNIPFCRVTLRILSRLSIAAFLAVLVATTNIWIGEFSDPRHSFFGVVASACFYLSVIALLGWLSFSLYNFLRTSFFRTFGFVVLFVWGCVSYCLFPVDRGLTDEASPKVQLRNQLEGINRSYATFFPSRGGFEDAGEGMGWVHYHLFHISVITYLSVLMFSLLGRGIVNRIRLECVSDRKLNVFWGMSAPGLMLAKDIVSHTLTEQVLFYLPKKEMDDSSARQGFVDELDREDCIWAFADLRNKHQVSSRGTRHFFLSESGHANIAQANRVVGWLRAKSKGIRPTFYIRIESSSCEQVYFDWVESVKKIVTPVILRESALISRQLVKNHPALLLPGISVNQDTKIVRGCFSNLILGFDSVGEDILNALICNSQFKGSMFVADVVSMNKSGMERYAYMHTEAVKAYGLNFHVMDVLGADFEAWIATRISKYNRIVICTPTDDLNMQIVMNLIRVSKDAGATVDKRCVFVRIANPDIYKYSSCCGELSVENFFGSPRDLFTMEMLNRDRIDAIAKVLNAEWAGVTDVRDFQKVWDDSSFDAQQSSRASALGEINHLNVLGFTINDQYSVGAVCDGEEVHAHIVKHVQLLAENEHLRWNAYHRTRGYSKWDMMNPPIESMVSKKANQLGTLRKHAAIVDFEALPDVDLKLAIARNPKNQARFKRENFIGNVKNDIMGDGKRFTPSMQAYDMMFCLKIVQNVKAATGGDFRRFGSGARS